MTQKLRNDCADINLQLELLEQNLAEIDGVLAG